MFEKISYKDLSAKQKEIYNFQKIAAVLADYGYNCIKLADDWHGADFLAYHKDGSNTLKVQLKGRITINKKYIGKDLWIAFPLKKHWYMIEHSRLLELVETETNWLLTPSWTDKHAYSAGNPSRKLLAHLEKYRL